jgi:quercetin dioxygenase-like cupin family protein
MKPLRPSVSFILAAALATALKAQQAPLIPYQPPANPTPLGTTFVDWDSLSVHSTPFGQTRAVFDNPTPTLEKFEVHVTTLLPGTMPHPPHHHPWEEMMLVREGELEVSLNGKKVHAGPGSLIFAASNDVHGWQNVGGVPATYYVINFYTDLVHTVPDRPAAEQSVPGMLPSCVIDCDSLPVTPTKTGSRVAVVDSQTLTFVRLGSHITTLNVGQSTLPDIVDSGDELFVLKSGVIEARVDGVTCRLRAGSLFYCAPNAKRTFRNIGTTPASYQVIKVVSDRTPKQA